MSSDPLLTFVRTSRETLNTSISRLENEALRPLSDGFVSRLRPLFTQISYASSRLPQIREKYPSLIVGSSITIFSIPALITRGRMTGVVVGGIAGGLAGFSLKVMDFIDGKD
ncbi:hypothetical protein TrVE_jg13766 [Triparma verrucosa]|uniref:Uncharacterized protein n=1 Tax=Triparma verrucosa TaxID=1606542 RepID=A0A9W7CLN6_9STRA|nr:hypothetical protein TrVE_jg13766 [Triparma verrucosa]